MNKLNILIVFVVFYINGSTYYVSTNGKSTNTGKSYASGYDIITAISKVSAGDSILLQGGVYKIPYVTGVRNTIVFSKSGLTNKNIYVLSLGATKATFDFSFAEQDYLQDCYGFDVSGSYWYFKNINITKAGYQGAYVKGQYNTFENCAFYENRNSGLELNKGGAYTMVINCDAYRNYDPKKLGSMADGFAPKQTQGAGNTFIGCRAWNNSDDGYDTFDSDQPVIFKNCWAFNNGIDIWNYGGFAGNGNGFKVGGNSKLQRNVLTQCVAFGNPSKGFDQNNNTGGVTMLNCTSYNNGINFGFGGVVATGEKHVLKNNISLGGSAISVANATQSTNSWNSGFSVSSSDFQSLDVTKATLTRNADGTIPETTLFRLKNTSKLIDVGTNVGLVFYGSKPDLGAFETGGSIVTEITENEAVNEPGFKDEMYLVTSNDAEGYMIFSDSEMFFEVLTSDGAKMEEIKSGTNFGRDYKKGIYIIKSKTNSKVFKICK